MRYRTRYGLSLDALTARLSHHAKDDALQGADWAMAITEAFLLTPSIWPLGDELFEVLLAWAGVESHTTHGVEFAVAISQYLDGTGICPIVCTHPADDPSPRCARVRNGELSDLYARGLDYEGTHDRDFWIDLRTRLAGVFDAALQLPDDHAAAEHQPDTDQEYPDAA